MSPHTNPNNNDNDAVFANTEFLTSEETIKRRHRHVTQLSKIYRDHYWALMDDLKSKHRDFLWKYGGSPLVDDLDEAFQPNDAETESIKICAHSFCKQKAMALTRFCHSHILSDSKQVLYKGCAHVTPSRSGSVTVCGKPILRSVMPSLCTYHLQRMEKPVVRALRQAGLHKHDSERMAHVIHIVGAECVREILKKRRAFKQGK